jgi:hypothetical protein
MSALHHIPIPIPISIFYTHPVEPEGSAITPSLILSKLGKNTNTDMHHRKQVWYDPMSNEKDSRALFYPEMGPRVTLDMRLILRGKRTKKMMT